MQRIGDDLFETTEFQPFDGVTTHAYLWTRPEGNVCFYSPGDDADFDAIEAMGGIVHQYLSHQDEAGPMLARISARFGAHLHVPAAEVETITRFAPAGTRLAHRHVDANGVEVIPAPGHSPGSTAFTVRGAGGSRYLFTGDTVLRGVDGAWFAGYVPGVSDAASLRSSLELLGTLEPDLVASSAFTGDAGAHWLGDAQWADCIAEALASLTSRARS